MDPITLVGKTLISKIAKKFGDNIITRWSRYRAESFFNAFIEAISEELDGSPENEVDQILEKFSEDSRKSEVLFEAYRRVCLSASKELGPRIIGLLVGRLLSGELLLSNAEEDILSIAESLNDTDFDELSNYLEQRFKNKSKFDALDLELETFREEFDSNWHHDYSSQIGHTDLRNEFGPWAQKLQRLGVISELLSEQRIEYQEDSERHIDQDGTIRVISGSISFPGHLRLLIELVRRAQRSMAREGDNQK